MATFKYKYNIGAYLTTFTSTQRNWIKEAEEKVKRAKQRGEAFVSLYAASKQLVDNYPKRYPYLQYWVEQIEQLNLAPKLDTKEK